MSDGTPWNSFRSNHFTTSACLNPELDSLHQSMVSQTSTQSTFLWPLCLMEGLLLYLGHLKLSSVRIEKVSFIVLSLAAHAHTLIKEEPRC